ncbi:3-dehydroquinate synthase II [Nocardia sp. NPDC003482]
MTTELWADVSTLPPTETPAALAYVRNSDIATLVLRPAQLTDWEAVQRIRIACVGDAPALAGLDDRRVGLLVAESPAELEAVRATAGELPVGVRCVIDDADSMNVAVSIIGSVDVLIAAFTDTTNIPLELLLAEAQTTRTKVFKELLSGAEAGSVAGVLESGPAGLVVNARHLPDLERVAGVLRTRRDVNQQLVPFEVVRAEPTGMGYRGCIDTTTLFGEDEGMIVGSTSAGGLLVCAEVHYLPYMNLRPFRVNAGAVHSYVFGAERTSYITDLAAGERSCAVSASGRFREVSVGRVKVELRPLRLLVARNGDVSVNVFLQDDWHVRVMSAEGKPLNLTDVRPGTELLGRAVEPGRHVGIKVAEQISEF